MKRRVLAGVLAAAGIAGLAGSFAASLNLDGSSLGAGTAVIAACQPAATPVKVGFTNAYSAPLKAYQVTAVKLDSLAGACTGLRASVTLTDSAGAVLFEGTATVASSTLSMTVPAGVSAANVVGTAVVLAS